MTSPEWRTRRGWGWPVGLALALLSSAALNVAFAVVASRDASFAVEPDYYRRSLEWDRTMAQEDANNALDWHIEIRSEGTPRPGTLRLAARLTDRAGHDLEGAQVAVEARHAARAATAVSGTLVAAAGGRYVADLPLRRAGLWELRFVVRRDGDVYTQRVTADLPGAP